MKNASRPLNIGLVLLSPDFRVIGINDYARRLYGPVLKEMGHSVLHCHSPKSRERVSGMLRELINVPSDMPSTMVIDVVGKVIMFNLSQLSIIFPTTQTCWSVSFIDVSRQTGAKKNPQDGMVEMKRIPVYDGRAYQFLSTDEVPCIQSDGDYCKVFTATKSYYLHLSLKTILQRYPGTTFFRAHKSFIVNLAHVNKVSRNDNGQALILFNNTSTPSVPVSRRRLSELRKAMRLL